MKLTSVVRFGRNLGLLAVGLVAISGCVNVRYDDEHADRATRMAVVAQRFNQTMKAGGMFGVTADLENCYREASVPLIKRFALQDCMSYDYAAAYFDREVGRVAFNGARTPYFEDRVAAARLIKYGKLDGFGDGPELIAFLTPARTMILANLQRMPGSILAPAGTTMRPRIVNPGGFL